MQGAFNMSLFDLFDSDNENIEELKIDDKVYVEYQGESYIGTVHSIYNNKETVNVIFDNMHTAFHISKVKKV
ncbi:hypothetical protein GKZ28_08445 [Clostridium chromiireducens]|jgi:hypothetical protein|uniref:DUF2187 domain-containing protein n=1 Tax=Clostridium chromiireducens TaxID=225345 RepID=A0A964RL98_9CLOT|nr:hypothetical protein [Clostridium chromiireducens]MVX63724.1 hypothetical protein [Clostridium chromiireducens]